MNDFPSGSPRKSLVGLTLIIGAFTLAMIRLVGLVNAASVNVLYADQWDFLTPLFQDKGPLAAFLQQHGPHRQGIGGLLQWLLYPATGWNARAEAWCAVLVLTLAAILATRLAIKQRGHLHPSDAIIPLIVLSPLHWETMLLTTNVAHSILPFGMLLLLAHTSQSSPSRLRSVFIGLIGASCVFTGFGFCVALALVIVLSAKLSPAQSRPDRQNHALTLVLVCAGFALFFLNYRWDPAIPGWVFPVEDWWNYGTFAGYMMASLAGLRENSPLAAGTGLLLFMMVVAVCGLHLMRLWRGENTTGSAVIALLTATSMIYAALTAYGRLPINIEAAFMWRYLTLMMPGLLGVILYLQTREQSPASRWGRHTASAAILMIGLPVVLNVAPEKNALAIAKGKQRWTEAYLQTGDADLANQLSEFWVYPQPQNPPHITERLHWLEARDLSFLSHHGPPPPPPIK